MGLLTATDAFSTTPALPDSVIAAAPEVTMLSQGLSVRVGAHPDDLCPVENLTIGDSIWDLSTGRLVDLDGIACATLDGSQLAEMGLRPLPVRTDQGSGWFALASSRLLTHDPASARLCPSPQVFFRFWAETRLLADVAGRPVRLRNS